MSAVSSEMSYVEVSPELRKKAEEVLDKIGMSYSMAVDLFTRQIILRRAFPVELNLPERKPLFLNELTDEELDSAIDKGIAAVEAGKVYTIDGALSIMEAEYGRI